MICLFSMRSPLGILSAASVAALVAATSLDSVCTVDYVQARLPADDLIPGVSMNPESIVVNTTLPSAGPTTTRMPLLTIAMSLSPTPMPGSMTLSMSGTGHPLRTASSIATYRRAEAVMRLIH